MIRIREFIKSGGASADGELFAVMRDLMSKLPASEQKNWLRQVELSLDGYGGSAQISAVQRVRDVLKRLEVESTAQALLS